MITIIETLIICATVLVLYRMSITKTREEKELEEIKLMRRSTPHPPHKKSTDKQEGA